MLYLINEVKDMVNYPNKKASFTRQKTSSKNRGMNFEAMINESNEYYLVNDVAVIHKKPIPIQIVNVDYPSRSAAVIKEAYYKVPSTTDYNGIYKGQYIDFEAKETLNKTSFPLSNIHSHQIEHLNNIKRHDGISFVLIFFKVLDEIYLLPSNELMMFYQRSIEGRKSITISEIREKGYLLSEGYAPRIDYLKVVDILLNKKG
jgi:recombination protein U